MRVIFGALTCQVYFGLCCVIFSSSLWHMVTLHFPLSSRGAVNGDISSLHRLVSAIWRQPRVFIVGCHLSVKNAFVSISSLCELLIFLLLHLPHPHLISPQGIHRTALAAAARRIYLSTVT